MKFLIKSNVKAYAKNIAQKRTSQDFLDQLEVEVKKMIRRACNNATRKHNWPHKTIHDEDLRWDWS